MARRSGNGTGLTKEQASAFRERWRLVNSREIRELQTTDVETRWHQFLTLMSWARELQWIDKLDDGSAEIRERWARLRRAHRG